MSSLLLDAAWLGLAAGGWLLAAALGLRSARAWRQAREAASRAEAVQVQWRQRDASALARERFGKELSVALHRCSDHEAFGTELLALLCRELGAHAGAFHRLDPADGRYALTARYAGSASPAFVERYAPGEGLAGQAVVERRLQLCTGLASDWMGVQSGTLSAAPLSLAIGPLVVGEAVPAVVELALMRAPDDSLRALLDEALPLAALHLQTLEAEFATRAEFQRFRAMEELQRRILGKITDGIFGQDAQGRVSFVNAAALQMLGFEESEVLGQPMHALTHHHYPDGREFPREECPVYLTLQDGMVRSVHDQVFWRKDGTPLPVEYSVSTVGGDGSAPGVVISFRDISERERTQRELQLRRQELQDSEARLRLMFETAHEGIWVIDTQARTLDLNPEMSRILGVGREAAAGRPIFDFVDEANAGIFRQQMQRREQGEESVYLIHLRSLQGTDSRCLFHARPLLDRQGQRTGSFAMVLDLARVEPYFRPRV